LIIGIGTPCLFEDVIILDNLHRSIANILVRREEGRTVIHKVYMNDGSEGLKKVREDMFNDLFYNLNCDVVLQASADFYLFPDILEHIDPLNVTAFTFMTRRITTIIEFMKFRVAPNAWSGCYSISRNVWQALDKEGSFNGSDDSVNSFCKRKRIKIKRVRTPKYYVLRYSKNMIRDAMRQDTFKKKFLKLLGAW